MTIRDLNSLGGTFVNDERLAGPRVFQPGDVVRFADLAARFEPADAPEAAVTRAMPVVAADRETAAPDGARAVAPGSTYTVAGTVLSPAVGAIAGLTVQLVDKNVGGDQSITSAQTARNGSYSITHFIADAYLAARHKTSPDFQVQVLAGGAVVAMSDVAYSASSSTSLDVVLPAVAPGLPSEYETLTASVAAVYPGSLGTLQENATQQDITYLAGKTELDARVVALMALASQFGQLTPPPPAAADTGAAGTAPLPVQGQGIAPEFYYALFRAGLPASTDSLFRASPATVQAIWEQAVTGGVIPQRLAKQVPAAVASFQAIGAARSLDAPTACWHLNAARDDHCDPAGDSATGPVRPPLRAVSGQLGGLLGSG